MCNVSIYELFNLFFSSLACCIISHYSQTLVRSPSFSLPNILSFVRASVSTHAYTCFLLTLVSISFFFFISFVSLDWPSRNSGRRTDHLPIHSIISLSLFFFFSYRFLKTRVVSLLSDLCTPSLLRIRGSQAE